MNDEQLYELKRKLAELKGHRQESAGIRDIAAGASEIGRAIGTDPNDYKYKAPSFSDDVGSPIDDEISSQQALIEKYTKAKTGGDDLKLYEDKKKIDAKYKDKKNEKEIKRSYKGHKTDKGVKLWTDTGGGLWLRKPDGEWKEWLGEWVDSEGKRREKGTKAQATIAEGVITEKANRRNDTQIAKFSKSSEPAISSIAGISSIKEILTTIIPGGEIDGFGTHLPAIIRDFFTGSKGKELRAEFGRVMSGYIKKLSGAAASDSEVLRVEKQFQTGIYDTGRGFLIGMRNFLRAAEKDMKRVYTTISPEALKVWEARGGDNYLKELGGLKGYFEKYISAYDKAAETGKDDKEPSKEEKNSKGSIITAVDKDGVIWYYVVTGKDQPKYKKFRNLSAAQKYAKDLKSWF